VYVSAETLLEKCTRGKRTRGLPLGGREDRGNFACINWAPLLLKPGWLVARFPGKQTETAEDRRHVTMQPIMRGRHGRVYVRLLWRYLGTGTIKGKDYKNVGRLGAY